MGLLDDAIREHLELKRRHGGDASEIARLENEVLGADHGEAQPVVEDPAVAEAPDPATPEIEPDPPVEAHPEPEVAAEPEADHEDVGQPTVAFSLEEREAAVAPSEYHEGDADDSEAPGEHDELEETPEFLQETPEHDRMWFEQKPPRDFDF